MDSNKELPLNADAVSTFEECGEVAGLVKINPKQAVHFVLLSIPLRFGNLFGKHCDR
jgi:hypothetical protein